MKAPFFHYIDFITYYMDEVIHLAEKRDIIVSGYAYPSINPSVLDSWLPDLTILNTFSYGISPEGNLVQLDDQNLINAANRAGVKPVMVLTPMDETGMFSDKLAAQVLSNPDAQVNLIDNIEANVTCSHHLTSLKWGLLSQGTEWFQFL